MFKVTLVVFKANNLQTNSYLYVKRWESSTDSYFKVHVHSTYLHITPLSRMKPRYLQWLLMANVICSTLLTSQTSSISFPLFLLLQPS